MLPATTRRFPARQLMATLVTLAALALPQIGLATVANAASTDCISTGYTCTPGYTGNSASETWAWRYYGAPYSNTTTGTHNCTLYAAMRLALAGMPDPGRNWGDASNWGNVLPGDSTPRVGAIAWYSSNHVAVVDQVEGGRVFLTADNYSGAPSGGYTTSGWVDASTVTKFLHPYDQPLRDLFFVKTTGTGSGRVEVHTATAASGYGEADLHVATRFSSADASNGWFQMVGKDLYFIKTRNTGSGRVEVHTATAASGYSSGSGNASWLGTGDQSNGWFQMVGKDLYFIKTRNTGSGRVEIHNASYASGYGSATLHTATWFGTGDQNNGFFQMVGRDLFFIKTKNTGGQVEIHTATALSGYSQADLHAATWLSTGDADNGWFQMLGRDLVFIKTKNTASRVEVHTATRVSGYTQADLHAASWFGNGNANYGWFQFRGAKIS